jgi:serine/threonine-protein kinase
MGVVYRAEDRRLKRVVAVKVLRPAQAGDLERRQRFLREARTAAALTHPNVVAVYDVGDSDGSAYIAMELVPGETLRARLRRGPLGMAEVRSLALQIAQGLAAAHERGIVHRDLKPENVMVTPEGTVKLLDFGLAKLDIGSVADRGSLESAETELQVTVEQARLIGTVDYMSPEQVMAEPLTVRSDVFSFGVMLYEMLCGVRPFQGSSATRVLVSIARDPPAPLRSRLTNIDPQLEAIAARCLLKAPEDRFANAGEIVAELARPEEVRRPAPIWRVVALLGAPAMVGLGVLGAGAIRGRPPATAPSEAAPSPSHGVVVPAPAPCVGPACNDVVDVTAGDDFGCVALRSGVVWCWGGDGFGQLGTRDVGVGCTIGGAPRPCRPEPAVVPGLRSVVGLSASDDFACALTESGQAYCWGRNDMMQLGHATGSEGDVQCGEDRGAAIACNPTPTRVPGVPALKQIITSERTGCGLSTAGQIYCWGASSSGQAGFGAGVRAQPPSPLSGGPITGRPDSGALPVMAFLTAAKGHACAIDVHQHLWCWGDNMYGGALGHPTGTNGDRSIVGSTSGRSSNPWPQQVAKDADGNESLLIDVESVATADAVTCAVTADGRRKLLCWGWALSGVLGVPGFGKNTTWRPNEISTPVPIHSLAGRENSMCGIGEDATVWCWGSNARGELGRGVVGGGQNPHAGWCGSCVYYTPQAVPGLHAGQLASSQLGFVLALSADGALYGWGSNGTGQTGHLPGTRGDRPCDDQFRYAPPQECNPDPVKVEGLP